MELKAGSRWRSAVCTTEVIVIRPPAGSVDLACGGAAMLPIDGEAPAGAIIDPTLADGTQLGKRYADDAIGIEVLCTKPGDGTLTVDGGRLPLKEAKPLPSSD
jgi:hypothetical protein